MKKFAALILALILAATCAVSAMASANQWVDIDLDGYKVVYLFNYNESVALATYGKTPAETMQAVSEDLAKKETEGVGASGWADPYMDTRYVISSIYVAGFEANEVVGNGSKLNVVPVDLTVEENTAFVYPIATNSHVVIGLLYAKVNVEEGFVQIEGQLKDEIYSKTINTLTVYTTKAQLNEGGDEGFDFAAPISIEEDLGGAPAILISITGKVTYPTIFGNMASKDKTTGDKIVNMNRFFSYQDYYRYEKWVRTYRTNMTAALALVAE